MAWRGLFLATTNSARTVIHINFCASDNVIVSRRTCGISNGTTRVGSPSHTDRACPPATADPVQPTPRHAHRTHHTNPIKSVTALKTRSSRAPRYFGTYVLLGQFGQNRKRVGRILWLTRHPPWRSFLQKPVPRFGPMCTSTTWTTARTSRLPTLRPINHSFGESIIHT